MRRSTEGQLMSLISLGDGSTLSLDFTTGVLDPRLTFTRTSGGTYTGNDGYIYGMDLATSSSLAIGTGSKTVTLTATAGVDRRYLVGQTVYFSNGANNMSGPVTAYSASTQSITINATASSGSGSFTSWAVGNASARFDHDPTTLAARGLLIEGSATNLALRSNDFNTTVTDGTQWVTGYTRGNVSTTLPDGTTGNACQISGTGSNSFRSAAITVTASTAYTWSFWARNNGGSQARYRVWNVTGGSSIVDYTLSGSNYVSQIGGANNTSSTWVRVSVSFTTPVGCTSIYVYPASSDSGTVDLLVWGAQVEAGSGASSYIPTGASQVTRNADKMSMTDITTMQWNQTAGTFFLHMDVAAETNTSSFPAMMGMYTATPVRVVRILLNNSSGTNPRIGLDSWTTAPAQILASLLTRSTAPTAFKYAAALSNTGQALSHVVNNGSVTTATGTGTLQTPTRLLWHQDPSAGDTEYFPVHLRTVKYWPTNLPDATLKAITT